MKSRLFGLLLVLFAVSKVEAVTRSWTNVLGGSWFVGSNWAPAGVPTAVDDLLITNSGTYSVVIPTNAAVAASVRIGGLTGTQTLIQGSTTALLVTNVLNVRSNGMLIITNAGFVGNLRIEAGATTQFSPTIGGLQLYHSTVTNLGTVKWLSGSLAVGGSNNDTTSISNAGLWQIQGDLALNYGGGSRPVFLNSGILRKIAGAGQAQLSGIDLINSGSGLVEVQSGSLRLGAFQTNVLGGTLSAASGTILSLFAGTCTDAGGITTGNGQFLFQSGTFYLRTNTIPGFKFLGGDLYIQTNTFQLAGAITNLTLDGAQLHGTNRVAGVLTLNSGSLMDRITVLPSGKVIAATAGSKLLYSLNLINQGTVDWSGGNLAVGANPPTVISNGGLWQLSSDDALSFGGGLTPWFTNAGTIRKISGPGISGIGGCQLVNLATGLVQVDTGTIAFAPAAIHSDGEFRLNGGTFQANGGFSVSGAARIDGSGKVNQTFIVGGTLTPGLNGPGKIIFQQGLNLGPSSTFAVDGTGVAPGSQHDQVVVNGTVSLTNATLKINALPTVPIGTTFVLIDNDGADPVLGTFGSLPENHVLSVGGQAFRIHYSGGTGNDVVLIRDTGVSTPTLSSAGYSQGNFVLTGLGGSSVNYTIQASTNLSNWTTIATVLSDPNGHISFTDTNASKFRYRFYRTMH